MLTARHSLRRNVCVCLLGLSLGIATPAQANVETAGQGDMYTPWIAPSEGGANSSQPGAVPAVGSPASVVYLAGVELTSIVNDPQRPARLRQLPAELAAAPAQSAAVGAGSSGGGILQWILLAGVAAVGLFVLRPHESR